MSEFLDNIKWQWEMQHSFPAEKWEEMFRRLEEAEQLQAANAKLREVLVEVNYELVALNCTCQDGTLDSMAISTNAEAMRFLAEHGRLEITNEYGRRVIGKWIKKGE